MNHSKQDIVLRVSNVSKVYGLHSNKYGASIKDLVGSKQQTQNATFHTALNNVSFELTKGESLGIIGPNGSGKSTLLRILSGITKPSNGHIEIYGRRLSILDIGTGFHPDLTGRENIYLNGELLGLSRNAIKEKINDIIEFSELTTYIDESVKNYSSGMYLRLAFSVIAFLDGDLLLFDETMSVGDLSFRMKCRNKMEEMVKEGKTMIIVSHNINEVVSLCNKYMHIENGEVIGLSKSFEIVKNYIEQSLNKDSATPAGTTLNTNKLTATDFSSFKIPDSLEVTRISLAPIKENSSDLDTVIYRDQPIKLLIEYNKKNTDSTIDTSFSITDAAGNIVLASSPASSNKSFTHQGSCRCTAECIIYKDLFNKGAFFINVYFIKNKISVIAALSRVVSFQINIRQIYGDIDVDSVSVPGALAPSFDWTLDFEEL